MLGKEREMRTEDMPWWLHGVEIVGFEEEDDSEEDDDEDESEEEEDENSSDDEDEDEEERGADDDEEDEKPNVSGLKSALRKERMARKKLEREIKKLKAESKPPKKNGKDEADEEEDKSSEELEAERKKSERLAVRLRDQAIDTLILRHAKGFADPDDAVRLVNRSEIEFDQDEDDPSVIEVDEDSVKDAVKALAKKKKHLLATGDKGGSKSGSKFGGKAKSKKEPSDEALRQKYAALRR